jgi:signal peptidase II
MKRLFYLLVSASVLAADQVTKAAVSNSIPPGGSRQVTSWFALTHWLNPGGLFGMLQQLPRPVAWAVFLLLPLAGLALLVLLFLKAQTRTERLLLAAILGGAAGNLADRVRLGAVVDFLYFHLPGGPGWPSFNLADAVLSTGILALLALTFIQPHAEARGASHPF